MITTSDNKYKVANVDIVKLDIDSNEMQQLCDQVYLNKLDQLLYEKISSEVMTIVEMPTNVIL